MKNKNKNYDIGVIIGRFQVHKLHPAHREIIGHVLGRHKKVIIFLGVANVIGTRTNPLDFATRKKMIQQEYSYVENISAILPIRDRKSDELWSEELDKQIRNVFQVGSVVLYGSRNSFIPHYKGMFDVIELESSHKVSGSEIRDEVSNEIIKSPEFRAGIIYSSYNNYPTVYSVVDVAILNDKDQILLGKKLGETEYRFIGGFVDIKDESDIQAVRRETYEETGVEIGGIEYITSMKIDDWRYKNEPDKSMITRLFKAKYIFGKPTAGDDLDSVHWVNFNTGWLRGNMVPEHRKLLDALVENIHKNTDKELVS